MSEGKRLAILSVPVDLIWSLLTGKAKQVVPDGNWDFASCEIISVTFEHFRNPECVLLKLSSPQFNVVIEGQLIPYVFLREYDEYLDTPACVFSKRE